jgi:hypothetical protein
MTIKGLNYFMRYIIIPLIIIAYLWWTIESIKEIRRCKAWWMENEFTTWWRIVTGIICLLIITPIIIILIINSW